MFEASRVEAGLVYTRRLLRLLGGLAAMAGFAPGAGTASADPVDLLLLGDSITFGRVSGDPAPSWAELVALELGDAYRVENIACNGTTSLDWTLSQGAVLCGGLGFAFPNLFEARATPMLPARYTTVLLGTNDAVGFLEPVPVPVERYALALEEISGNLIDEGSERVILMTPPRWVGGSPEEQGRITGYRSEVLRVCESDDALICGPDLYELLDPYEHFDGGDSHPNAEGQALIADELLETLARNPVPEPSARALHGLALLCLLGTRLRRSENVEKS